MDARDGGSLSRLVRPVSHYTTARPLPPLTGPKIVGQAGRQAGDIYDCYYCYHHHYGQWVTMDLNDEHE